VALLLPLGFAQVKLLPSLGPRHKEHGISDHLA
jgi:hypothetical protein